MKENAGSEVTDSELREILDRYLNGESEGKIAIRFGRTPRAIESLLVKIRTDYTEDGKRTPMMERLNGVSSSLDRQRKKLNKQAEKYFEDCHQSSPRASRLRLKTRLPLASYCVIFNLPSKTICKLEKSIIGGFGTNHYLNREAEAKQ